MLSRLTSSTKRPLDLTEIDLVESKIINYLDEHHVLSDPLARANEVLIAWANFRSRPALPGQPKSLPENLRSLPGKMKKVLSDLEKSRAALKYTRAKAIAEKRDPITGQVVSSIEVFYNEQDSWSGAPLHIGQQFRVFKAWDKDGRQLVVKRPAAGVQQALERRIVQFKNEAMIWAGFRHDHIVPYLGCFLDENLPCLVSPFAFHGHLAGYIQKYPEAEGVRLLKESADGLAFIHRHHVHGDVKCENIVVTRDHHAQIIDFGLTKIHGHSTSTGKKGANTHLYTSPERHKFPLLKKTSKSDVYAFGMIIAAVLNKQGAPFPHDLYQPNTLRYRAVVDPPAGRAPERPARPPTLGPLEAAVWAVGGECWQHRADDRPEMAEVLGSIQRAMSRFQYRA